MKASDLFVQCLEAEGVTRIFGIPGEENLDFLESLRTSPIEFILCRHEQAAGFMAATWGRLTGSPGVCLSTLGPGACNLVTAAAYANLGAFPMVMITGQKPVKNSKQGRFQIIDVVDMMQPLTKMTRQIPSAGRIPAAVREAFRVAAEERPGCTHLELPEDIAKEPCRGAPLPASVVSRPDAGEAALEEAVATLQSATHPLLLVGAGANRTSVAEALLGLVEKAQLPFVTTQMGKGVIDDEHPMALGACVLSDDDFVHRAIDHADVIVNVGHDVVEKPPFFMEEGGTRVIHVDYTPAEVDPVYFPQIEVVGDIAGSVARLAERLERPDCWDCGFFNEVREAVRASVREGEESPDFPLDIRRVVAEVRRAMPDDGIIALDNGMYKIWFARNYPARGPNTVLLDNALATMGAGLPSALAAALLHPDRRVLAVCGDGGFMMNPAEIETAVRLGVTLVVLVLRDDALGMIRWKQSADDFPAFGLQFGNPDFVKLAAAYGACGRRLEEAHDLAPALEAAYANGGVHIVEAPVDYANNDRLLNDIIPAAAAAL
ncbi:MAG: acetolactate synthase large subunit [Akkermansiaceae bacterium]|nr:acetolactate synthase large subunit [Akkermansiaceae bacterium]